jgi:hypothetical protein
MMAGELTLNQADLLPAWDTQIITFLPYAPEQRNCQNTILFIPQGGGFK